MTVASNNLLMYYGDLYTVGGAATISAAVGILLRYDAIVIKTQSSNPNLNKAITIIYELKQIKPGIKIFGYTDLGNAADMPTWQAEVDAWTTNLSAQLLDGVFIDNFGFDFTNSTRTNQNAAITYCHTDSTFNLSAFVSCTDAVDALGTIPSEAAPLMGRNTLIPDYLLLPNFFYKNDNAVSPSLEAKEDLSGRLQYVEAALISTTSPLVLWNILVAATVGGGTSNGITSDAYLAVLNSVNQYGLNFLSVNPYDFGATSNKYFYRYRPNTFTD